MQVPKVCFPTNYWEATREQANTQQGAISHKERGSHWRMVGRFPGRQCAPGPGNQRSDVGKVAEEHHETSW